MDIARLIASLERFETALPTLLAGLSDDDARRRGPDDAWSILEIVTHLADEEVEDFRTRVDLTLQDPAAPWPPIDPERAAVERRYNDGDLASVLERFRTERRASVRWLRGLQSPDWSRCHEQPPGPLHAGDILAAWTAHDILHLRQIAKRLYELVDRDAGVYGLRYAGSWTA